MLAQKFRAVIARVRALSLTELHQLPTSYYLPSFLLCPPPFPRAGAVVSVLVCRRLAGAQMTDSGVRIRSCSPEMRSWKLHHQGGSPTMDAFSLDASPPVSRRQSNACATPDLVRAFP